MFQTAAGSFDVEVRRVIEDHEVFYVGIPEFVSLVSSVQGRINGGQR
jgi:hypothetical protein